VPKRIFAVFCVSYGSYTWLQNDSFYIYTTLVTLRSPEGRTKIKYA